MCVPAGEGHDPGDGLSSLVQDELAHSHSFADRTLAEHLRLEARDERGPYERSGDGCEERPGDPVGHILGAVCGKMQETDGGSRG